MSTFVFAEDLQQTIRLLCRLDLVDRRRTGNDPSGPFFSEAPAVSRDQLAQLERKLGAIPPDELVALAALKLRNGSEYGLKGVDHLAVSEHKREGEAWQSWIELTSIQPFWYLEKEIDSHSDLPEVVALGVSGPEDVNAPRWAVLLAPDRATYALVGGPSTKYDEPAVLQKGSLAAVYDYAVAALLDKLPTYRRLLDETPTIDTPIPTVEFEPPAAQRTVNHPKFGTGRVLDEHGKGDQRKLTIAFDDVGTKVLLARFVIDA